jgi:hypothetical protein
VGIVLAALGVAGALTSTGVATAGPYCYDTGPGYQKCVSGGSGSDYLNPLYQGPKIYSGVNTPWAPPSPAYAPPVYSPSPADVQAFAEQQIQTNMQTFFDDPANGKAQYGFHIGHVSIVQAGGNTAEAVAMMSANGGPEQPIPIHITSDGQTTSWHIDPGALQPLLQ